MKRSSQTRPDGCTDTTRRMCDALSQNIRLERYCKTNNTIGGCQPSAPCGLLVGDADRIPIIVVFKAEGIKRSNKRLSVLESVSQLLDAFEPQTEIPSAKP